jgi:hypothetical protein
VVLLRGKLGKCTLWCSAAQAMFLFGADCKDVCEEEGLSLATVEDLYAPTSCAEKEKKAGHPLLVQLRLP